MSFITRTTTFIMNQLEPLPRIVIVGQLTGYLSSHIVNVMNLDPSLEPSVPLAAAPAFATFVVVSKIVGDIIYKGNTPPRKQRHFAASMAMCITGALAGGVVYFPTHTLPSNQLILINLAILVGSIGVACLRRQA